MADVDEQLEGIFKTAAGVVNEKFAEAYTDMIVEAQLTATIDERLLRTLVEDGVEPWDIYQVEIALFGAPLGQTV